MGGSKTSVADSEAGNDDFVTTKGWFDEVQGVG